MNKILHKIFGGINVTWPRLISFAVIMGVYTALMAMLVPDGNSFHDIAVTPEWWVLPAILIIVNCKTPVDAALKVFVFFLISQPLVYLIQVPFNSMGWALFGYYRYWFMITLLTLPGGFVGWFVKKDKWYSGLILSVMAVLLVTTGVNYAWGLADNFPNHLLSIIYCFGIIPVFIFGIFKDKWPRIITAVASVVTVLVMVFAIKGNIGASFETYNDTFLNENGITLVGEPYISAYSSFTGGDGDVEIVQCNDGCMIKLKGVQGGRYNFTISDDTNDYSFEYYFDKDTNSVVINKL